MAQGEMPPPSNPLADIEAVHDTLSLNIMSGNQVSARTTAVLKHLQKPVTDDGTASKPVLVRFRARANVVNKLVTITEIVKRQLATETVKVYQYSVLGSEMITLKPKDAVGKDGKGSADGDAGEEDEEEAFEVMGGKEKVRNVPTLTVYLSLASVQKLRRQYGYVSGRFGIASRLTMVVESSQTWTSERLQSDACSLSKQTPPQVTLVETPAVRSGLWNQ